VVLAVGVAVPLTLRRRRRGRDARTPERSRLVEEIAALDDALEAGSVSREEHAERRGTLKQQLLDLTAEGVAGTSGGRRARFPAARRSAAAEADEARR
jgi:hypothetical protein